MSDTPKFIMLMGLPGTGKSTLRSEYGAEYVHLSTDDYIEESAKKAGKTYDEMFQSAIKEATSVINLAFEAAIGDNKSVVWDQTNLSKKKRKKVFDRVPNHYRKVLVMLTCDEATRQKRLKDREGKTIPVSIDKSMQDSIEYPTTDEGWDRVVVKKT